MNLQQFFPYYQPIVDVLSGRIGGYEALARCRTDDGTVISAWPFFSDDSIPNSDKLAVDRHVRSLALATFASRHGEEFISVNISPALIDASRDDLGEMTLAMLDRLDIPAAKVVTEILESKGKRESVSQISELFRRAGLLVAIDDFGAGHSHMERLFDLRPDFLKIDMNLFRRAARGGVRADYLQALRYVTERNSIRVVCEGVETEEEFMFAMDCGARYIQGFLFSPATPELLPPDTFQEQVGQLRERYLLNKTRQLDKTSQHQTEVEGAILALKARILAEDYHGVDITSLRELGVFRFFVCKADGEQVSSNYNLLNKVTLDRAFCGFNWSTRPYFAELMARREALEADDHIVCSSAYKDQERQELCRTYGLRLDSEHLLLVDVSQEDPVTYVKASASDSTTV